MSIEQILPTDERINSALMDFRDSIDDELRETAVRQDGDVVSIQDEFYSLEQVTIFREVAKVFATLSPEYSHEDGRTAAVYRGLMFAYHVAEMIYGSSVVIDFGHINSAYVTSEADVVDANDVWDRYSNETQVFMEDNPEIDAFIGYYIDELDEDRNYHQDIEQAAAYIFMHAERHYAETYFTRKVDQLTVADFED